MLRLPITRAPLLLLLCRLAENCLLFLLVDEVESLTAARSAAATGSEPSDAIRVVNAVLTAIDALRTRK